MNTTKTERVESKQMNHPVTVELKHPELVQEIGQPALLKPGSPYPSVKVISEEKLQIRLELIFNKTGVTIGHVLVDPMVPGKEQTFAFSGIAEAAGQYEIRIQLSDSEKSFAYDAFYFYVLDSANHPAEFSQIVFPGEDGKMEYVPDYKGNRVADFSNCGYMGGGVALPEVPVAVVVEPVNEEIDATPIIQKAIDEVSELPLSPEGFRGAVLLKKGTYTIRGTLSIHASGVVLRGEGQGEDGTVLYSRGEGRKNILEIKGLTGIQLIEDSRVGISDQFVPSGARTFHVEDASGMTVGDTIIVTRYGNESWISAIDMDTITPRPNAGGTKQWSPFTLEFDRVITAVEGNQITVDAALTNSIEARWGGGDVVRYEENDRIQQVGVENLRVHSEFDPSITDTQIDARKGDVSYHADENHAVNFVLLDHVRNAWVRDVTGYQLEHALVLIDRFAKWITVQDCTVREMVSIITGGRRYAFHMTGQLSLVQRTDVETARHAFVFDSKVAGPNVFLNSESRIDYNMSEPHHRWSVGGLFDCITAPIFIQDRGWMGSGHGWAGANYVAWNTVGKLVCQQPPTAQNYTVGHVGEKAKAAFPNKHDLRPRKEGYWDHYGSHVHPRSLYLQQLEERLGKQAVENILK